MGHFFTMSQSYLHVASITSCRSFWSIKMRWMIISLLSCWLDSSFLYTPPPQFPTLLPKRIFLFWIVETFFSWVLLNQGKIHKRVQSPFKEWKSVQSSCILSYFTHFDKIQKYEENIIFSAPKFKEVICLLVPSALRASVTPLLSWLFHSFLAMYAVIQSLIFVKHIFPIFPPNIFFSRIIFLRHDMARSCRLMSPDAFLV